MNNNEYSKAVKAAANRHFKSIVNTATQQAKNKERAAMEAYSRRVAENATRGVQAQIAAEKAYAQQVQKKKNNAATAAYQRLQEQRMLTAKPLGYDAYGLPKTGSAWNNNNFGGRRKKTRRVRKTSRRKAMRQTRRRKN